MIIKRSLVVPLIQKYSEQNFTLYGCSYVPMALFFEASRNRKGIFICRPLLNMRDNHRSDRDDLWEYFFMEHIRALEYLATVGYDAKDYGSYVYGGGIIGAAFEAIKSKYGNPRVRLANKFIKEERLIPFYVKFIFLILDIMPIPLLSVLYKTMQRLRGYSRAEAEDLI